MSIFCFSPTVCGNILKNPINQPGGFDSRAKTENHTVKGDFNHFFVV
jgi:hypothetical protein